MEKIRSMFAFAAIDDGFELRFGATVLLRHDSAATAVELGIGAANVDMCRGNFRIEDELAERWALDCCAVDVASVRLWSSQNPEFAATCIIGTDGVMTVSSENAEANRIWLHFPREASESIWGGGEQMSYLRLNGRRFPFWTSEPGVGQIGRAHV